MIEKFFCEEDEDMEVLPFMFRFGEEVVHAVDRQAGMESEYWTQQYNVPDTD